MLTNLSTFFAAASLLGKKLLVVGGRGAFNKVELVDLFAADKTCPPLPDYPGAAVGSVGTYIDGMALVCGGITKDRTAAIEKCHFYNQSSKSWELKVSMGAARSVPAGAMMSNGQWWVTGGSTISYDLASTEVFNGKEFSAYVDLPEKRKGHNLVQVNTTHFMLLGGYSPTSRVWMFDSSTELWTSKQDLLESRSATQAGLVKYADGRRAVVVAGSYEIKSSEIFDLDSETWRAGPDLPVSAYLYGGAFL